MKAASEIYKGIEYVRISNLPDEQKVTIWTTLRHDKVIKILKDDALFNDCIQYQDYVAWFEHQQSVHHQN